MKINKVYMVQFGRAKAIEIVFSFISFCLAGEVVLRYNKYISDEAEKGNHEEINEALVYLVISAGVTWFLVTFWFFVNIFSDKIKCGPASYFILGVFHFVLGLILVGAGIWANSQQTVCFSIDWPKCDVSAFCYHDSGVVMTSGVFCGFAGVTLLFDSIITVRICWKNATNDMDDEDTSLQEIKLNNVYPVRFRKVKVLEMIFSFISMCLATETAVRFERKAAISVHRGIEDEMNKELLFLLIVATIACVLTTFWFTFNICTNKVKYTMATNTKLAFVHFLLGTVLLIGSGWCIYDGIFCIWTSCWSTNCTKENIFTASGVFGVLAGAVMILDSFIHCCCQGQGTAANQNENSNEEQQYSTVQMNDLCDAPNNLLTSA